MAAPHVSELLAKLLEYPAPGLLAVAERCRAQLATRSADAAEKVDVFAAYAAGVDVRDLEELYARTFDLNPAASMDLGFQLFGESYKRGIFLVKMKRAVRAHDVDAGSELPDHLPVMLRLLARLTDDEDPRSLVDEVILPTVTKVLEAFGKTENPYVSLLRAVVSLLCTDFRVDAIQELPHAIEMPFANVPGMNDGKRRLDVLQEP